MTKRRVEAAAVIAAALLPPPAQAAFPGTSGILATAGGTTQDDIHTLHPDGTGDTVLAPHPSQDSNPAWSPDGRKIAFESQRGGDLEIFVMDADGGNLTQLTDNLNSDRDPAWSPDGARLVFESFRASNEDLWMMNADGSNQARLTTDPAGDRDPAWSPDGTKIAFTSNRESYACEDPGNPFCFVRPTWRIFTIAPDGSGLTRRVSTAEPWDCGDGTDVFAPDWSPNGAALVFESIELDNICLETYVRSVVTDGPGGRALYTEETDASGVASGSTWSPDGREIAFRSELGPRLMAVRPDGTGLRHITGCCHRFPSWQAWPGYPRPKSALRIHATLVPAYVSCTSPNRTHGPPLASPSCSPPAQRSTQLTVGTPDANGQGARSTGVAVVRSLPDDPVTPADEADVRFRVRIADVRTQGDLADYKGELQARHTLRITDKNNAPVPGVTGAATTQDFNFTYTVPCAPTEGAGGSTCDLLTHANTLLPGAVKGGTRAIWSLARVEVLDGGPDGDAETPDNSLFAVQGIFVP